MGGQVSYNTGGVRVSYDISGMTEIVDKINELGRKSNSVLDPALEAAAQPIRDKAYDNAPVRTGEGREAIKIGKPKIGKGGRYVSVGVHQEDREAGDFHMYYQELGTSRMAANPYLRPAYEEKKREAYEILKRRLKEGLGL